MSAVDLLPTLSKMFPPYLLWVPFDDSICSRLYHNLIVADRDWGADPPNDCDINHTPSLLRHLVISFSLQLNRLLELIITTLLNWNEPKKQSYRVFTLNQSFADRLYWLGMFEWSQERRLRWIDHTDWFSLSTHLNQSSPGTPTGSGFPSAERRSWLRICVGGRNCSWRLFHCSTTRWSPAAGAARTTCCLPSAVPSTANRGL